MYLIIINNKTIIKNVDLGLIDLLTLGLVFPNPKFETAQKFGYSTWNIPKVISLIEDLGNNTISIPRGYTNNLFQILHDNKLKYKVHDERSSIVVDNIESNIILRPYQQRAIDSIKNHSYGILKAPAGSGKTVMGLSLPAMLNQKTLWLTHTTPLANQAKKRIKDFLPKVKVGQIGYGNKKWTVGDEITIGSLQTIARNLDTIKTVYKNTWGLVILDEAHHAPANMFMSVISSLNPYFLYGLTATDKRSDGLEKALFSIIGPVIYEITREEINLEKGVITPELYGIELDYFIPQYIDNYAKLLEHLIYDDLRNNRIVTDVLAEASHGHPCIVVSNRKAHTEILYEKIKEQWPFTGIATGNYSKKEIEKQITKLINGEISVLIATTQLLGEGFDYAPLSRLFLALPLRNEAATEQLIGRVQRTAEGKYDAKIFDYIDNHGLLRNQFFNKNTGRANVYKLLNCIDILKIMN